MQKRRVSGFPILCLIFFLGGLPLRSQPADILKISETAKKITVDGDLEDWAGLAEFPVQLTPEGQVLPPSNDLAVKVRFTFDDQYFYAAVLVLDDRVEFPDRKRREGDGFYLTFADPSEEEAEGRPLVFGFSRFDNEPLAVMAQADYEDAPLVRDIQLKIKGKEDIPELAYELAIPWKLIRGFRPFLKPEWSLNLSYDDLDDGQKKVVQIVPDPDYEPDNPAPKKTLPCEFAVVAPEQAEFQSLLNADHFFPEDERQLNLAVHSPKPGQGWQARMIATTVEGNFSSERSFSFESGLQVVSFPVKMEKTTTGAVDLSLGILDDQGKLRYTDNHRFFIMDSQQFKDYEAELSALKAGELASQDAVFRESLPTVEVRLQWIREFMEKSPPFADLRRVEQWNQDIKDLFRKLDEGQPALFMTGRTARLGYRSEADGSLRSYSVFVPDWYDGKTPLPLLVTLSGRGGGPRAGLLGPSPGPFGRMPGKKAGDFFILTPEVENPKSWYIGADGQRVIETIAHLEKIYSVDADNIILDGFAGGGYGALRLALQNPGVYKGVIVRSGRLIPPENSGAESIIDMLDRAKNMNLLIIHGEKDKEAPVEEIRGIVARLEGLRANVRYIEVKDAGARDYDKWSDVLSWLRDVLGDSVVELKPPKKEKEKDKDKEPDKKK